MHVQTSKPTDNAPTLQRFPDDADLVKFIAISLFFTNAVHVLLTMFDSWTTTFDASYYLRLSISPEFVVHIGFLTTVATQVYFLHAERLKQRLQRLRIGNSDRAQAPWPLAPIVFLLLTIWASPRAYFNNPRIIWSHRAMIGLFSAVMPLKLISYLLTQQEQLDKNAYQAYFLHDTMPLTLRSVWQPWFVYSRVARRNMRTHVFVKAAIETMITSFIVVFCAKDWMEPMAFATAPDGMDLFLWPIVKMLRMNYPALLFILCSFYNLFHGLMIMQGEFSGTRDIFLYFDWWNCLNVQEFWGKWNQPVHRFFVKHVYIPAFKIGMKKPSATMTVFVTSGLLHDYVIYMAFGKRPPMFLFVFLMSPLIMESSEYVSKKMSLASLQALVKLTALTSVSMIMYGYTCVETTKRHQR